MSKNILQKLISQNKVIPFVGAGVSMSVKNTNNKNTFLSWKQLLEKFADKLEEYDKKPQADNVRSSLSINKNYLSIADDIKDFFPNDSFYYDALEEFFDIKRENIDETSLELAKSIWSLGLKLVITTNYDKVLHWASPKMSDTKHWDIQSNYEQASSLRDGVKTNTVWHIHGHIDNKRDIILTTESYNRLYNDSIEGEFKTAISTLKNHLAQKSFLFIGYSLDDKFFVDELEKVCNLFDNSSSEHYILLREENTLPEKLEGKILPIYYADYGQPLIDCIHSLKSTTVTDTFEDEQILIEETNPSGESKRLQVCIYTASPLNENIDYDFGKIRNRFSKYDIDLYHKILTDDELMDSYDYDDVFIFTKTNKDKIIIEDEFCIKKSITIQELEETINAENTYLFIDNAIDNVNLNIVITDSNKIIKSLNSKLHEKYKDIKGKYKFYEMETELPQEIDKNNLINFIGRQTDIENIIRKTLVVKNENQILTIKGSGGIGKTTIISKVAVELAERGKFNDGIKFIQCEYLNDYHSFESKIAVAFDMNSAIHFEIQLKEQELNEDRLIILDNVETLLYLDETDKIKELIKVISDYATIVLTTREILNEEFEDIYELFKLTTDEAEELFTKLYKLKKYEQKVLRTDILENFLDNNPLAIKIVTRNLPKGKNLTALKEELGNGFFDITSNDIEKIFEKESDLNIERTKSLFHSINYSYQKLSTKEKLALETLSLFPDGQHMENFKNFYNQDMKKDKDNKKKIKHKIENFSDKDIKALENKSLIVISKQFIGLQSIVGRFADYKFNQRSEDNKLVFYERAYKFNSFIAGFLNSHKKYRESFYKKIFDENKNNFSKSLEYISMLEFDTDMYRYINNIANMSLSLNVFKDKDINQLNHLKENFKNDEEKYQFLESTIHKINYFNGSFDEVFEEIKNNYPLDTLLTTNNIKNTFKEYTYRTIATLYEMEGNAYEIFKFNLEKYNKYINIPELFSLGNYDLTLEYIDSKYFAYKDDDFFYFEFLLSIGKLDVKKLDNYIKSLHKTQHLARVESLYTLIKFDIHKVTLKSIKKLIVVNPFADGLKLLMVAMKEDNTHAKEMYEFAIEKLFHIKYYHVEAILIYTTYLKKINDSDYNEWLEKGLGLAQKHYYRYLQHKFICLRDNSDTPYDESNYPYPDKLDYSKFIKEYELDFKDNNID